jgi:hypothetical protein
MTLLRGLSLWNPHAGLMAIGAKGVESRPRTFGVRGSLAIQATVGIPAKHRRAPELLMFEPAFAKVLHPQNWFTLDDMPRGAIVAVVWVDTEVRTSNTIRLTIAATYGPDELKYGWYEDGRVAMLTDRARLMRLPTPVPCSGKQGLFELPPNVLGPIAAQLRSHPNFRFHRDAFGAFADAEPRRPWKGFTGGHSSPPPG